MCDMRSRGQRCDLSDSEFTLSEVDSKIARIQNSRRPDGWMHVALTTGFTGWTEGWMERWFDWVGGYRLPFDVYKSNAL